MFKSSGILRYTHQNFNLVLDCDPDLGKYYRHIAARKWLIRRPAWKEHITIIRGPYELSGTPDKNLWGKYEGNLIKFKYEPFIETKEPEEGCLRYFWLSVFCPKLMDIREELGLPRKPVFPLHLTIGNLWG